QRPFFLSEGILKAPLSHCWQSFKYPVLRRCRFEPETINWRAMVGYGSEGCVFRVRFGSEGPFAVKIFWHSVPHPTPGGKGPSWPLRDECKTAAVLEKMRWAVADEPITIRRDPSTPAEALRNVWAFSAEGRAHQKNKEERNKREGGEGEASGGEMSMSSFPDIPKCHGWMKFKLGEIPSPYRTYQRCTDPVDLALQDRYAIVYDYVPSGKMDVEIAQAQLDFFYRTGFAQMPYRESNWRRGRLVDFGDLLT
ncbi:hypothetical protein B0T18DRAFT_310115, partial [Schizothecium vesticola]